MMSTLAMMVNQRIGHKESRQNVGKNNKPNVLQY